MKILVSNDDGIHSEGIRVLAERLAENTNHDVYVAAPDGERSATGHSLTLHKPLRAEKVIPPGKVKAAWKTTGTPSDCVKLAVLDLMETAPDIVISGINNGSNLGSELLYSGTVAAAMEGAFLNIPSMAVSQVNDDNIMVMHYETAAEFVARLIEVFPATHLSKRSLLNVNVPNVAFAELNGAVITELGVRLYDDRFEKRTDPRGRIYYWLTGHPLDEEHVENTDTWAVWHKMISVTPISFNMTDHKTLERLRAIKDLQELVPKRPHAQAKPKAGSPNQAKNELGG